jgi:hypothetical protein
MAAQGRKGAAAPAARVHSIAGLLRGREIAGEFEAGGRTFEFAYAPTSVSAAGGRVELVGDFTAAPAGGRRGRPAKLSGVRATLAATQGGIGQAPKVRRDLLAQTSQGAETGTPDVQERDQGPGAAEKPAGALPVTESTGPTAFVGVMYLRLSPLDARALGAAADMSAVQLNARLAPTSETERELQWLFSGLVAAAGGAAPDAGRASAHADAINRLLKG